MICQSGDINNLMSTIKERADVFRTATVPNMAGPARELGKVHGGRDYTVPNRSKNGH